MGRSDQGSEGNLGPSLLAKRERFHLAYRLASRSYQILLAKRGPAPMRNASLAAACVVGDVVSALAIRRSGRFALGPRLAFDAADAAFWSQGSSGLELATMPGVPLAIEAGLRIGAAGVIVPLVNATVTGSMRRRMGRSTSNASFRYQVMAVALGAGIAGYERNRRAVALARHEQSLEARAGAANLAGQNDVATGADTVVDLLSRTAPLLSSVAGSTMVGRMLADWRQSLAATTTEHASYLGITLTRWQRRHNESQPNLSADVTFAIEEGHGTILLSAEQSVWLGSALDQLALRGLVTVAAVDLAEAKQPNRPRRLLFGPIRVDVPADSRPGLVPFDVGPLGFLASAMWFGDTIHPGGGAGQVWAVAPGAAAGPVLALWAHRLVARRGETAHGAVLGVALCHSLVHAVGSTATMRNFRNAEGIQRFPFLAGINMVSMMVPLYWSDFDSVQRCLVVGAIGVVIGVGLVLFPEAVQWSHLIAELLWPAAAFFSMMTLRSQLDVEAVERGQKLELAAQTSLASAFSEGRSFVLELASATRYAAHRDFEGVRDQLDPRISAEIQRRLTEVDKRLKELQCVNVS